MEKKKAFSKARGNSVVANSKKAKSAAIKIHLQVTFHVKGRYFICLHLLLRTQKICVITQ